MGEMYGNQARGVASFRATATVILHCGLAPQMLPMKNSVN